MKKVLSAISRAIIWPQLWLGQSEPLSRLWLHAAGLQPRAGIRNFHSDCVFTGSGACEQQWGWDITGAYQVTIGSRPWLRRVFGSYMEVHYSGDALTGFGGAVGVSNLKEGRVGTNLVWTPLKGFDVGAEFMYVHLNETRPVGLAPNAVLNANGLPAFQSNNNQYEGRLRVQRAF